MSEPIDLGGGHTLRYTAWAPDRDLNPQYAGIPDVERFGAIESHPRPDGQGQCEGAVTFDGPAQRQLRPNAPRWTVESWEPLTLSPSILCKLCGNHGYIREGRWIPA